MGLEFYDDTQTLFSGGIRRDVFNATSGSVVESLMHIRNDDALNYYTGISISVNENVGLFGTSGFTTKMIAGSRQPTEAEWSQVAAGTPLSLSDLGSAGTPDTTTYLPFWVRMFCPAGFTLAQVRDDLSFDYTAVESPV